MLRFHFMDGLGFLEAEELQKAPRRTGTCLLQSADVGSYGGKVDDGERIEKYDNRLHSDSVE